MGTKLYVGNLPFAVTSQELGELFAQAGEVVSANIITDRFSGQSRGFGFVEMSTDDAAVDQARCRKWLRFAEEAGRHGS